MVEEETGKRGLQRHPVRKTEHGQSFDQQQVPHLRLCIDAEQYPRTNLQILPVMADLRHRLLIKALTNLRQHLLKHGAKEIPLVSKLVIKRAARDACLADDFFRADCGIASLREKATRRRDQLFAVPGRLLGWDFS